MKHSKNLPQYKKVYEVVRKSITDGLFKTGDLLPSENELCKVHGVTRPTVRKALGRLENEGFIKKHQGKGSIVKGTPKGIGILSLSGTTTALEKEKLTTSVIINPEIRQWEKAFSFSLSEQEKESGCIYLERLRKVNGQPVFFDITMIPNVNFPRFTQRNFENKSLFEILRKFYQIEIIGGEQKIMAISADKRLQSYFHVDERHPVLQLDRKMETNRIGLYIYSQVFCNTDEYSLYGTF